MISQFIKNQWGRRKAKSPTCTKTEQSPQIVSQIHLSRRFYAADNHERLEIEKAQRRLETIRAEREQREAEEYASRPKSIAELRAEQAERRAKKRQTVQGSGGGPSLVPGYNFLRR